jgi:hypothetical protein
MTVSNISSDFMLYQGFLPGLPAKNIVILGCMLLIKILGNDGFIVLVALYILVISTIAVVLVPSTGRKFRHLCLRRGEDRGVRRPLILIGNRFGSPGRCPGLMLNCTSCMCWQYSLCLLRSSCRPLADGNQCLYLSGFRKGTWLM